MADTVKKQRSYIGYEYKELTAESSMMPLLIDGYENFGWELNESV